MLYYFAVFFYTKNTAFRYRLVCKSLLFPLQNVIISIAKGNYWQREVLPLALSSMIFRMKNAYFSRYDK